MRALLATDERLRVVAEASTGAGAITAVASSTPDVVLMDVHMPGVDGVEATRRIVDAAPHVAIVVLTMHDDDGTVFAALRAGARGYLLKGAPRAELLRAIHAAAAGEALFGPAIARRMMAYFGRPAPSAAPPFPELSAREREILELVAAGRSNADIADTPRRRAQDHPQPRLDDLRQAPGARSGRGHRARPRGRSGRDAARLTDG